MRPLSLLALSTLLAIALAACGGDKNTEVAADSPGAAVESWPAEQSTDGGSYLVTLEPVDGDIERSKHFSLDVHVTPGENAVAPMSVLVDADMPAHRHGMNTQPEISKTGDNNYRADGMLFHMAGDWVITVDVVTQEGVQSSSFTVSLE